MEGLTEHRHAVFRRSVEFFGIIILARLLKDVPLECGLKNEAFKMGLICDFSHFVYTDISSVLPPFSCVSGIPFPPFSFSTSRWQRAGRRSWPSVELWRRRSWSCGLRRWRRRSRFSRLASKLCRLTTTSPTRGWPPCRVCTHTLTHGHALLQVLTNPLPPPRKPTTHC